MFIQLLVQKTILYLMVNITKRFMGLTIYQKLEREFNDNNTHVVLSLVKIFSIIMSFLIVLALLHE